MRTRKLWIGSVVAALTLCLVSAPSAQAQTLEEIFDEVLDLAVIAPLPATICPLVQAAEVSDSNALVALEISVGELERQLAMDWLAAEMEHRSRIDRQKKACAQIKTELVRIKNERTSWAQKVREAKEGGRFLSLHARVEVSPLPNDWNDYYRTWLIRDSFSELPGDEPNGPIVATLSLSSVGCKGSSIRMLDWDTVVWGNESSFYNDYPHVKFRFADHSKTGGLDFSIDSFEAHPGQWTGINFGKINPSGSKMAAVYNFDTGRFDIRFEGMLTNELHDFSKPILFFANIFGAVQSADDGHADEYFTAGASVGADVPILVPLPKDLAEPNLPRLMGAHVLKYDACDEELLLLENTTLEPGADIAMARYADGSYAAGPGADMVIGQHVEVEPLPYIGESPPGHYNFGDASVRIMMAAGSGNRETMLNGRLSNVVLDTINGGFFADLEITGVNTGSTLLAELYGTSETTVMQIAAGAAVYDLVEITEGFTGCGRLAVPELFFLGAVRDCDHSLMPADFDFDGIVGFADFANLARFWMQDESSVDIAPPPKGDNAVNPLDLSEWAESWLSRCE